MDNRLAEIERYIRSIEGVSIESAFVSKEHFEVEGKVLVSIPGLEKPLAFDVTISPEYPFKRFDTEAIRFSNKNLLPYGHVMGDGSICIHTSHCVDLCDKLLIDFNSLKRWISDYYIKKKQDANYEHIIAPSQELDGQHYAYFFTDVDYQFAPQEHGFFTYNALSKARNFDKPIHNNVVQTFLNKNNKLLTSCKWGTGITSLSDSSRNNGLFVFLGTPPAQHGKFIFANWEDLEESFGKECIKFLSGFEKANLKRFEGGAVPLLIGYKIPNGELHWQCSMLKIGSFPIGTEKIDQKWQGYFLNQNPVWGITKNCSYDYFFGRGRMADSIIRGNVLIIGIGAIGSMVANILTRGGCTDIDIIDFDVKEPGNVCRSEYHFDTGIGNKTDELSRILYSISPFLNIKTIDSVFFNLYAKALLDIDSSKNEFRNVLKQYDFIFDCSTDNDLMYAVSQLQLNNLITLSITNKAQSLICGVEPGSYNWVINQVSNILKSDMEDLYNPTGCWNPTFKASYNDIGVLVHYAMKHINQKCLNNGKLRNFILDTEEGFAIKLKEF